eukprot:scaffold7311_cov101-Isochrysis_galbana.AAC.1
MGGGMSAERAAATSVHRRLLPVFTDGSYQCSQASPTSVHRRLLPVFTDGSYQCSQTAPTSVHRRLLPVFTDGSYQCSQTAPTSVHRRLLAAVGGWGTGTGRGSPRRCVARMAAQPPWVLHITCAVILPPPLGLGLLP